MPELSVFIPTLPDRKPMLTRVVNAIVVEHPDAEIWELGGPESWGKKLNVGAELATGDYWLCCCDDTVPWRGWFEAGRAMLDSGSEPASRYFQVDGSPEQPVDLIEHGHPIPWCRSFLLTPEIYRQIGPFIDATWYADWDYSERLTRAGIPIRACDGFSFTHLDGPRDWHTPAEDARQRGEYEASHRRQGIAV